MWGSVGIRHFRYAFATTLKLFSAQGGKDVSLLQPAAQGLTDPVPYELQVLRTAGVAVTSHLYSRFLHPIHLPGPARILLPMPEKVLLGHLHVFVTVEILVSYACEGKAITNEQARLVRSSPNRPHRGSVYGCCREK
jgi:hypothetical protein